MLLLGRNDIKKAFTMKEAIEGDKLAFRLAAEEKLDVPLRTVINVPEKEASYVFMPAYAKDLGAASVKVVNVFPHNLEKGLKTCPGQVLLCDENGYIVALLDGTYITQLRTGAASGAAFDVLGKKECHIGGMIGTGGQAATQLEAMVCARKLDEVRIYDMDKERAVSFCERMQKELEAYGAKIVPVNSADEASEEADLFITMTPSRTPVFDGTKIKPGATVSCVGSYLPDMHECDPALLPRCSKIFCDLKSAAMAESGDLIIPINEGIIDESAVTGSLGDVINGKIKGRENDDEIIMFETVGIGAQDLVCAKKVYDKAVATGNGVNWDEEK
jgi:ornithine cyclodeaminase